MAQNRLCKIMRVDTASRAFLVLLVVLSMLGPLTLNILVPSLPGMAKALNAPKESVQLALSLYLLGMAVSQLVLGPLADRFGRRPVLLIALVVYILASIAAAVSPNVETLILARLFQSFGATAGLALGRTMIRDLYAQERAASMIGYVTMSMVLAPMLAPSIGGLIDDAFGWRMILAFCAVLGVISLSLAMPMLPETRPQSLIAATMGEVLGRTLSLMKRRRFMAYLGSSAFASGVFFAFLGAAPYLMIEVLGRAKTEYGLWFMSLSIGYMLGNLISGRNAMRLGVDRLMIWGNMAGLIGAALICVAAMFDTLSPLTLFLPAMIASFGNGLVLPNAIAAGIGLDAKAAGAASGLMGFGQMGVGALLTFIAGATATHSLAVLAILMLVAALLAILCGAIAQAPEA
jgi:MFS transporter, DHA1 family, multidrug resistance protein